jgi:hypothetical protein
MMRADMLFEIVAPSKSLFAQKALQWFVASMLSSMTLQVFHTLERALVVVEYTPKSKRFPILTPRNSP